MSPLSVKNFFQYRIARLGRFCLAALFFAAVSALFSVSPSWSQASSGQSRLEEIESRLMTEREQLSQVNSREKDFLKELEEAEAELKEKRKAIEALQAEIEKTEAEAGRLKIKHVEARKLEREAEDAVVGRLIAMYKYVKQGYLKALEDVEEPWQFLRRVKYLKAVIKEDRNNLAEVMTLAMERRLAAEGIEKSLQKIEEVYREEQSGLENLKVSAKNKVYRLMVLHKEKESYERSIEQLRNASEDLKQTLLNIEKRAITDVVVPESFAEMRGKLPFPLRGHIVKGKVFSESAGQEPSKGVLIALPAGADVKAVFSGKVDFSGKLKGYGELIIINHGERFFTVSANLSKRTRLEGDLVQKGDTIGVAGTDGISGESRFYFEIRKGGRNLDPRDWFALK